MTVLSVLTIIPAMVAVLGNQHAVAYGQGGKKTARRHPSANVSITRENLGYLSRISG